MPRSTAIGQPHHGQRMFAISDFLYRRPGEPSTQLRRAVRVPLARARGPRQTWRSMDPTLLLAGVAGLGGYGYWRPTELFRHAVSARLRLAGLRSQYVRLPRARVR